MNRLNKTTVDLVLSHFEGLKANMTRILKQYRADMARAKAEAAKYKDESAELEKRKNALVTAARAEIQIAEDRFRSSVKRVLGTMREEAKKALGENPTLSYTSHLRLYHDFGIAPSKIETETLLEMCGDNLPGLAMLNVVLQKTNAGLRINCITPADIEADLALVEQLANTRDHFVPKEFLHEGSEILGGTQRELTRKDGSTYVNGTTWDSVSLIVSEGSFLAKMEEIEKMEERWDHVGYREIAELSAELQSEGEKASPAATVEEVAPIESHRDNSEAEAAKIRERFVTEQKPPEYHTPYRVMPPKTPGNPESGDTPTT